MTIDAAFPSAASSVSAPPEAKPSNAAEAAQQFESLLIAQMLRSSRDNDPGSLSGEESDSESATMLDLANQQFAQLLSKQGGLGLSRLITGALENAPSAKTKTKP